MLLGIIKIIYNRTATHFMDNSFVNPEEKVIKYLLLTVQMRRATCVCVCVREMGRERERVAALCV